MPDASQRYLVALGSNRRHGRYGDPRAVVEAAVLRLAALGDVMASPVVASRPVGPSRRRFANAAAILVTSLPPPALLERLKAIERAFGRRATRRWGERVLDLDIVLWSGGLHGDARLAIPHPAFRTRDFVLTPATRIAPDWRDPVSGRTLRQLRTRRVARKPLDPDPRAF